MYFRIDDFVAKLDIDCSWNDIDHILKLFQMIFGIFWVHFIIKNGFFVAVVVICRGSHGFLIIWLLQELLYGQCCLSCTCFSKKIEPSSLFELTFLQLFLHIFSLKDF